MLVGELIVRIELPKVRSDSDLDMPSKENLQMAVEPPKLWTQPCSKLPAANDLQGLLFYLEPDGFSLKNLETWFASQCVAGIIQN